ncbi:MAG: WecB/TagA/CpsF family glycosyltransferase [Candidatus Peribacteraceae bacterium]|jgi:N-acetylglucosaminyldiphosphoundecaprenol N-acetyl-beta-D-mannosaminyltransferase|nr:WecB/TagA/CpsF family glycosyltransferase [Candidatus Peribacteraceae bacterium]|tara:strand:- start:538 stop:1296 length:759 start_codon:yes stop_codon:yes gene_type:complete
MDRRTVTLLGIPIDAIRQKEAIQIILEMLEGGHLKRFFKVGGQHHVITPNSEMLVESFKNEKFREVLQLASLNIPDSVGLLYAAKFKGKKLPERVTGVDTVVKLCSQLPKKHSVFLLGAKEGVAEKAAEKLKDINQNLSVAGTHSGSPNEKDTEEIIHKIKEAKPHLLLVAFGAPKQDLWIAEHLNKMPSVRVAMGVGGTFDFIAGVRKRAPALLRSVGLEWMYRLIKQPKRWKRISNAVVVFPYLVVCSRR